MVMVDVRGGGMDEAVGQGVVGVGIQHVQGTPPSYIQIVTHFSRLYPFYSFLIT